MYFPQPRSPLQCHGVLVRMCVCFLSMLGSHATEPFVATWAPNGRVVVPKEQCRNGGFATAGSSHLKTDHHEHPPPHHHHHQHHHHHHHHHYQHHRNHHHCHHHHHPNHHHHPHHPHHQGHFHHQHRHPHHHDPMINLSMIETIIVKGTNHNHHQHHSHRGGIINIGVKAFLVWRT